MCPTEYDDDSFDGVYEVDESTTIGTGKFAAVYMCWRKHEPLRRYALKVINTQASGVLGFRRVREEIDIMHHLGKHPNIVTLEDVDESQPDMIRIVMELCEGGELYDRIQQKQFYPESEAKLCSKALVDAVNFIHSKGIMHRDLKPENILLASKVSNTDVKISDFGLAKLSKDYPRRLPRSHSICGSDFYLAPEVIKQEEYGREIDIWALGVITYVLLSGSLPFFHNVLHKLYRQIVERDLSFPDQAWKNVSKGGMDFILRMLQARPGDRMTAAQALNHPWLRGPQGDPSFYQGSMDVVGDLASTGSHTSLNYWQQSRSQSQASSTTGGPKRLEKANKVESHASTPSTKAASPIVGGAPAASAEFFRANPPGKQQALSAYPTAAGQYGYVSSGMAPFQR